MNDLLISAMVEVLQIALLADKKEVSGEAIEKLLRDSALENNADISDEYLPVTSMYLIFADFSDRLGRALGYEIEPDGFALDWAKGLPHLCKAFTDIQIIVIKTMSAFDDALQKLKGFSVCDVFIKTINENTTPEIAAAQLELERNQLTIH